MISNVKNQKQKDELCSCAVVQLSGGNLSSNVKSSPPHENKSTFIVAMSIIVVPLSQS